MSVKYAFLPLTAAALLTSSAAMADQQIVIPLGKPRQVEQPRYPITTYGPLWAEMCKDFDEWDKPGPPVRIHGNAYYVGTCGISAILIAGDQGHILIDGGVAAAAPMVEANIAKLGYNIRDVKIILYSHEHFDHVAGIAKLQQDSGATLYSSPAGASSMATGINSKDDPQAGMHDAFPAARVGKLVKDGEQVRLGNLMVEAIATPGHTPGAMSWRWISCDGGVCRRIVYADSMTPVSSDNYRFSDHPAYLNAFRQSIAKVAASPCEIILSPHPSSSKMRDRFAEGEPLLDTNGCKAYADEAGKKLDERLAK